MPNEWIGHRSEGISCFDRNPLVLLFRHIDMSLNPITEN